MASYCQRIFCKVESLIYIVRKHLETLFFSKREPFDTSLRIPCCHIAACCEDSIPLIDTGCLICALDICIPFRKEAIVQVCNDREILGILRSRGILIFLKYLESHYFRLVL